MLTKDDIAHGLKALGVVPGDILMVHSALSSMGRVEGGSDALIDALIEAVGPTGTVAMPTLYLPAISGAEVFDVNESPSQMGEVTEVFRKRPGVLRSVHPTHPTAVYGARAVELIADHAKAPTSCGEGTPFGRLAEWGGKVLLLGVDQDRNTLLHTAEDYADCPFLTTRKCKYRDPKDGEVKEISIGRFPGPHRNFIGLDPIFREAGVMTIGKIGKAVCRLMDAGETVRIATETLNKNPAAVLCDNPACADCVRQRGFIRRAELDKEDFTLAVRVDDVPDMKALKQKLWEYGITAVEIGPVWLKHLMVLGVKETTKQFADAGLTVTGIDVTSIRGMHDVMEVAQGLGCSTLIAAVTSKSQFEKATEAAQTAGLKLLVRNQRETPADKCEEVTALRGQGLGLAFDPAEFAAVNQLPFLQVYYHGVPKSMVGQLYIKDGKFGGEPAEPGLGNGEIRELVSILRCRSFDGPLVIWPRVSISASCEAFWKLFGSL